MGRKIVNGWAAIVAPVIGLICGCGGFESSEKPLVDSRHRPIVLTERRAVGLPNASPGTRFVRGWRFEKRGDGLTIRTAGAKALLEIVQLMPRKRSLVLDLGDERVRGGGVVHARNRDRDLGTFDLHKRVEIPLPGDIGTGRIPIELEFSEPPEIIGVSLDTAVPRGRVEFEGTDVVQSGWSAVDFLRWVESGTTIVGGLRVPADVSPRQRFSIVVENDDGPVADLVVAGNSSASTADGLTSIHLPLETVGLVRIRLTAEGRGPVVRWQDLRLSRSRRLESSPSDGIPDPPKVLVLYVFDALRADHVGHLGSTQGASPCLDRLASEGVTFKRHFSVAPNTGPATASLFTGHGFVTGRGLSSTGLETLAEAYANAGFVTASISSNPHLAPSYGLVNGFEHVEFLPLDQDHRKHGTVKVNDSAAQIHASALRWLGEIDGDDSIFLYLHTLHPHNPYTPPEPWPSRFVSAKAAKLDGRTRTMASIRDLDREVTLEDQEWVRQRYTANLAYNDAELCRLMEKLEHRHSGEMMLVVTSDHGEELFDHDGVLHGYTLYDELLHVPMVVWWPGRLKPQVIDEPTDTLDLHATLRDLVAPPTAQREEDGRPLWQLMSGRPKMAVEPRLHFALAPGLQWAGMARSERWKLILVPRPRLDWGMGRGRGRTHEAQYLFQLETDPGEHSNIAGSPAIEADWLWSRLKAWQAAWRSRQPRKVDSVEVDDDTKRQLEALGYVE